MLATVDLKSPLLWALLIGWILSVVLHEFAHGIVAYWGGDYTIRERGGLTLNPLQYIDPMMSIVLPTLFLMMGGIPLPGGVTYIRNDLLRSRLWQSLVSLAGPAMNLLIFFLCALPLHPRFGWLDTSAEPEGWSNLQIIMGAMAILQLIAVLLNLMPIPPLDGFGVIGPFLNPETRQRLNTPPVSYIFLGAFFFLIFSSSAILWAFRYCIVPFLHLLGYRWNDVNFFLKAFRMALTGGA
jgi:Zn-dependent protease